MACTPVLTLSPPCTLYIYFLGSSIIMCWTKIWHIYFQQVHCNGLSPLWIVRWFLNLLNIQKVKCFLCLMAWDGLPSSSAEFLPPGALHLTLGEFVPPLQSWIIFSLWPHSTLLLICIWPLLLTQSTWVLDMLPFCKYCTILCVIGWMQWAIIN